MNQYFILATILKTKNLMESLYHKAEDAYQIMS